MKSYIGILIISDFFSLRHLKMTGNYLNFKDLSSSLKHTHTHIYSHIYANICNTDKCTDTLQQGQYFPTRTYLW